MSTMSRAPSVNARMAALASMPREGRVQRIVRRTFIANDYRPLRIGDLLPRCYPKLRKYPCWCRWSVRRALLRYALPLGRSSTGRGLPVIWAPRDATYMQHGNK